jgi:hypothetical protein
VDRSLLFCNQITKQGPGAVDAQNAMQRLSLDVIMLVAFNLDPHAVDFKQCMLLEALHYCFEEIFRHGPRQHQRAFSDPRICALLGCSSWLFVLMDKVAVSKS